MSLTGRLAPSPSGAMHLGNAFSALLAWLSARSAGGAVLLRLEDLDKPRCPARYAQGVMEDFRFLGLTWDNHPVWQSQRDDWYEKCLDVLSRKGLLYPCYCSRARLHGVGEASAPHGVGPVYDGHCRGLSPAERAALEQAGRRPALRVRVPDETYSFVDGHYGPCSAHLASQVGDFILRRSDGLFAYHLAVVADDAAMGVTQVVRGRDLLPATPQQLWLQDVLDFPHPDYLHLPLLTAPDGRRLSKREGDLSIQALSHRMSPREIVGLLACWAGLQPTPRPVWPDDLIDGFSWESVPKNNVVVTFPTGPSPGGGPI